MELKGFEKCPTWLRKKYIEAVNYSCQVIVVEQQDKLKMEENEYAKEKR